MRELDGDEIEITEQDGAHIVAKVTPTGRAVLEQLRAHQKRGRMTTAIDWSQCDDVESVPGRCSGAWLSKIPA